MDDKYKNAYRIPSARAPWHDYAEGIYFVTLCTAHREHHFGEIVNVSNEKTMRLTDLGRCAMECWRAIPQHFPHVETPFWVVMPNHIHGIVIIHPTTTKPPVGTQDFTSHDDNFPTATEETQDFASLRRGGSEPHDFSFLRIPGITSGIDADMGNKFGPQSKNLASVIRGFKIGVTKYARDNNIPFGWQSRFHDHIIRNPKELFYIIRYIENNIQNWKSDCYNE